MDQAENRKAIIVGIFLALGLAVFIVGILTLGGAQKTFSKNIHISATFDDVQGLKKGNAVWFSGVKVGTISDLHFTGPSRVDVKMSIDEASRPYIHNNAGVKISADGLIGNKIIVIDGGTPQAPVVDEGDVLHTEKMVSTDDMLKTFQQNNQNLLAITNDFKELSHKILQGKGTVGALLADSTMAMQLRSTMRNLQGATQSAAHMAVQLDNFSKKLSTKGGLADKVLTDTVTFNKIQASVAQLQKTVSNASELTQNLSTASKQLVTPNNAIGVLLMDPKGGEQVRSSLNNLQQSSVKLNETLDAAQHNFFLKGFFKKKAKAKADSLKNAGR